MSIAKTVKQYLKNEGVAYNVATHATSPSASRSAQAAHVTGEWVAKAVLLHDEDGYMLAVVPATHRLEFDALEKLLDRRLALATEEEAGRLFEDCDVGAIPPVANAYRLDAVIDESLGGADEVWFEGGDHKNLVHVSGEGFGRLMRGARQGAFSHHV